jgi:outer membrane receptor protein involved in Fe transport
MSPSWAQDSLPPVEVTTTFANPPLTTEEKAEATNRQVFDSAELENSSAEVLSDFLAEMGIGVYKAPTDYDHTLLTLRGFRTDHLSKELDGHVLFLIDGKRTGTNNPTQIPLMNVERVEILRGPEMLKYSGAAAGGIINVITKRGGPDKIAGSLELGLGSFDYYKTQVKLNGLFQGFDYSVGYSYQEKGNYDDANSNTVYHSDTEGIYSGMANFGYTFNGRHRIGWETYYYEVDKAHRPSYTDYVDQVVYGPSVMNRYNISNSLVYEGSTEDDRWNWQASYTFGENWSKQYSVGEKVGPMAAKFDRKIFQSSLTYNGDIFTITGGFDYLLYDTEEGAPGSVANPVGRPMIPTGKFKNVAGYLVGNVRFLEERLIFSAGLRYDNYKVSDKRQDPGDWTNLPPVHAGQRLPWSQTFTHLSPSVGVSYLPLDWLKLRANYTNSMRPPSPRELTSGFYEPYNFWGYPWNKAEKTNTYEAGFDLNFPYFNLSNTYFYSETKDYVYQHASPDVAPSPARQRVRNADKQTRSGVELTVSGNIAGALGAQNFEVRPYFSYSHLFKFEELFRRGYQGPANYGDWVDMTGQIPKTSMSGGVRFRYPSVKLSANLNLSYWGRSQYALGQWAPGFTIANFSLRKGLLDFNNYGSLDFRLDINNLFNKDYVFGNPNTTTYHMPGRSFYAGIIYNF